MDNENQTQQQGTALTPAPAPAGAGAAHGAIDPGAGIDRRRPAPFVEGAKKSDADAERNEDIQRAPQQAVGRGSTIPESRVPEEYKADEIPTKGLVKRMPGLKPVEGRPGDPKPKWINGQPVDDEGKPLKAKGFNHMRGGNYAQPPGDVEDDEAEGEHTEEAGGEHRDPVDPQKPTGEAHA